MMMRFYGDDCIDVDADDAFYVDDDDYNYYVLVPVKVVIMMI